MDEQRLRQVMSQMGLRPRRVLDHILEHGQVTTDELKELYGYKHPPRAARDVREWGVPIVTVRVKSTDGRRIAAYRLDDSATFNREKFGGRRTFSKQFKKLLYQRQQGRCAICMVPYALNYLQVDHRVPYEVAGEPTGDENQPDSFMLLCGTCNRRKSWSCEHCENWKRTKDIHTCKECYWGNPTDYQHIAMTPMRRVELVWTAEEVNVYEALQREAQREGISISEIIKRKIVRDS